MCVVFTAENNKKEQYEKVITGTCGCMDLFHKIDIFNFPLTDYMLEKRSSWLMFKKKVCVVKHVCQILYTPCTYIPVVKGREMLKS